MELGKYAAAAHDKETALAMRQAAHTISLLHAVCKLPPEFTGTRPSTRHLPVMQKQKKKNGAWRRMRQHTRPSTRHFAHAASAPDRYQCCSLIQPLTQPRILARMPTSKKERCG